MYAIVVCMYTPLEFTGARSLTLTHIYMYITIINQTIKLNNEKNDEKQTIYSLKCNAAEKKTSEFAKRVMRQT
jgi:hypothetical protein